MFDVEDLQAFVESAERGTFSAAALALCTTQPSLSRRIARLEQELGDRLFDRSNRRVPRLAPLGEVLLPYARQLLQEHDRFAEVSRAHSRGLTGIATIAMSEVAGELLLPTLYRYVSRRFPQLQVRILERAPGYGVEAAMIGREADLGFIDSHFMSAELDGFVFGVVQHVALGLPEYLGHTDAPIEWERVREFPLLLPTLITQVHYPVATRLDVVHEASGPGLLRAMARAGLGVAILAGTPRAPGLQCRPIAIDGALQHSGYHLAWPRGRAMSGPASRLVDDLRDRVAHDDPMLLEQDRTNELLS